MRQLLFLLVLLVTAPARAEELSVSVSGKDRDPLHAYKVGSTYYLDANEAGPLYGGRVSWYPVSGRLQMSFHGRPLQFLLGSDEVKAGEETYKLDAAVMVRTSQAFIPMSFFQTEEFSSWAGYDTAFDEKTKFVTIEKRSSVGSVRWFSYKDATRFTVELDKNLSYKTAARGVAGLEITIPYGTISASEQGTVDDGVVDFYQLGQQAAAAKLSIKRADGKVNWRVLEAEGPRRLVVELYRGQAPSLPPLSAEEKTPAKAEAPAAATPTTASSGPAKAPEKTKRRIVVDAGHGGKDPGATGRSGTQEKDINLKAAAELAKLLSQEKTFEVLMTRDSDVFVPLADRSKLANDSGADLFISLHCNASRNRKENGFEVYFMSEKATDPAAQQLADFENSSLELEGKTPQDAQAEAILGELSKTENINAAAEWAGLLARDISKRVDVENNGVKQAGFYVLRGTHAPAVLFEMAYITNKGDEAKLQSKKVRRRMIDGVYAGILDYAKREGWLSAN